MKGYKACFTKGCQNYENREKIKVTRKNNQKYCDVCGAKMLYVCRNPKCYTPLDEPLKGYCDDCLSEKARRNTRKNENRKNQIKYAIDSAPSVIPAVLSLVKKINKEIKK